MVNYSPAHPVGYTPGVVGKSKAPPSGGFTPANPKGNPKEYTPGVITQSGTRQTISSGGKLSAVTGMAEPNISLSSGGVGVGVGSKVVSETKASPVPLGSQAALFTASIPSASIAYQPGIVERTVQVPGRTETGPSGSRTFAPTEVTSSFYQTRKGDLFALPASVVGQKRAQLEARLIAAEGKGEVTASTVGRNLQAIGLGGGGVVAEYRNLVEQKPVSVQVSKPSSTSVQASVHSISPISVVASQGVPTREAQTRVIFKAGETGFEQYAANLAQEARFVTKQSPFGDVLGDVAAGFIGVAGGTAKVAETVVRAPFIASKASFEIATQGRPAKETYLQAAGNIASFAESTPVSVVLNVEKTVASETGQPGFRQGEELKQALIGAGVGLGVGALASRSASGLGRSAITGKETGTVLFSETRAAPAAMFKRGTFETVGEAKTIFGQKVSVPAGGEITTLTTQKGTQSLVTGVARPQGEIVPFVSRGLTREVRPGTALGVETTFVDAGKQRAGGTSVTASKTLAVTQEQAFQGQMGGKLPVGGTLDVTKSAVVGKSEGQFSTGSNYRVQSQYLVQEPKGQLPQPFDKTQFFKPEGKVATPTQAKQLQVTKTQTVQLPSETGVGKLAVQLATEKQTQTAQIIATTSKTAFSAKSLTFETQTTTPRPPLTQTSARPLSPSFSVQFEQPKTQTEAYLMGYASRVTNAPVGIQQERTTSLTRQTLAPSQQFIFTPEPRTQQNFRQIVQTVQPTPQKQQQQFFRSLTTTPLNPMFQVPKGVGGVFGSPKGGFDITRGGFKGSGLKGAKVKGRIPDLFNIGITQKTTGRTTYTLPTTRRITKSKLFRKTGGFLSPTGEQLRGLGKTPKRLGRFF